MLADSSKLGAIALHRVCPLDRIAAVITDGEDSAAVASLASAGVSLLRAERFRLTPVVSG